MRRTTILVFTGANRIDPVLSAGNWFAAENVFVNISLHSVKNTLGRVTHKTDVRNIYTAQLEYL